MNLTDHFTLEELIHSDTAKRRGLVNIPSDEQAANLLRLAVTVLEPARVLLNCPMKINSGFRSPALNFAIGGNLKSQHMDGCAADFVTETVDLSDAFRRIADSDIPFDQLIWEYKAAGDQWIHISCAKDKPPRREVLKLRAAGRKLAG